MAEDKSHIMSRFIDIEFDNKELPPISGYWSENLVPLEQALKLIIPRIEQLDRSIKAAKKYCHFPSEHGLTHDESAALYLYTMEGGDNSFYRGLNQALRSEDRPALKPWFPYLKLFDTAVSKLPTVRGSIWRGVPGDIGKDFKKNQELTWWSVTSCSLSVDIIKDFLASETTSTLFMIEAIHGKDISGYTNYSIEDEVLLCPGIQLRVAANPLNHAGGLYLVHLIEICDDSDEQLSSSTAAIQASPKSADKSTFRMGKLKAAFNSNSVVQAVRKESLHSNESIEGTKQAIAKSTSIPAAQAIKRESFSEPQHRHQADLSCGGRRCSTCGRCRDWKLIDGGNWKNYSDWKYVSDPDATCRYSHIRHMLNVLSWNCRCN